MNQNTAETRVPPATAGGGTRSSTVSGAFVELNGERYYVIRHVDRMPPFFVSVVSNDDHWLFMSSTGGLTAGRVSPETALFPYTTVDRIHDSAGHTGGVSYFRVHAGGEVHDWHPFGETGDGRHRRTRNLYKNVLGNKLCFEEINHDLELAFRVTWQTSERYGFVRDSELENMGGESVEIELLDGLRNVLPAGTPRYSQTNSSNLVDAYKWTEFDPESGLALFTLYSGITDRAEPCESLRANVAYCVGLDAPVTLLSAEQLGRFRGGLPLRPETLKRGVRGALLVNTALMLGARTTRRWQLVADTELSQADVIELRNELIGGRSLTTDIRESVERGSDGLARIMAGGDAFQTTAEEKVGVHHYANVLFNVLRGGIFFAQYQIGSDDVRRTLKHANADVYRRNRDVLDELPERISAEELLDAAERASDPSLLRLCYEYLPITFGRRHGDPSRPWNQFTIRLRDERDEPLLSYEGNWRDIFQNWEALAFSYPEFTESMIAKFVNASTADGYNPYRITKDGIDWEVEDPDDPWSYIGYWGDHQIIYLQKLLELSKEFHPGKLRTLLRRDAFCYANVPYRIRPFASLLEDPKNTVVYDDRLAERVAARTARLGADGKLLLDSDEQVYLVSLLEKLLVPLLAKLGNLVVDGGIWMNTQRPEWNDANNALVGQGLSMVTLFYLRRYVHFLEELLAPENGTVDVSTEVGDWHVATAAVLARLRPALGSGPLDPRRRLEVLTELGEASSRYRDEVYAREGFAGKTPLALDAIRALLADALAAVDHSIATNRRPDGLYHAYNLLDVGEDSVALSRLYPMLEGQVAALSTLSLPAAECAAVVEALFDSEVYRDDQQSFMLYPDRELPSFLDKNRIPSDEVESLPLLEQMLAAGDTSVILRDADGNLRFNPDLVNSQELEVRLDTLEEAYGDDVERSRPALRELYEEVFKHQAFTGRSGTMFGFEGLGCVYWHMVAKLLLAVQECFFRALDEDESAATIQRLAVLYYRVRRGLGFNKSPAEFGAFPTDPYSHTPKHAGARQPGMTGQVKEEILTRFGELGIRVSEGRIRFVPRLLRGREFSTEIREFRYLDVDGNWQSADLPAGTLAFTWCQVPIVYASTAAAASVTATLRNGEKQSFPASELSPEISAALFRRSGEVRRLDVSVPEAALLSE